MSDQSFPTLVPYGWNARVLALFTSTADDVGDPALVPGRVVRVERSTCVVVGPDGDQRPWSATDLPAVGDWVAGRFAGADDSDAAPATVVVVLPRWSAVTRRDPGGVSVQVLAADVDLVLITAPADRLSPARIERELAVGWDSGATPLVVLTKADLVEGDLLAELRTRLAGVDVVPTSAAAGTGLDEVRAALRTDRTAVLLGPSGAGKSSLTNALLGEERLATGAVREDDHRGRHTTTSRQLVPLPGGGVLIDTPGLRSLTLADEASGDDAVGRVFPEIEELAASCRFADCDHDVEPGCAVLAAVAAGTLDPARLANYQKLLRELAADARRTDPVLRRAEVEKWKALNREGKARGRAKRR